MTDNHGDPIVCCCGSADVRGVPTTKCDSGEFAFVITKKKTGELVGKPFYGTVRLVYCNVCEDSFAMVDSPKSEEHWASLPKWEGEVQ